MLDADHLAEIIATHIDMFYVSGSPPAGAKSAAQAILTALRTPSEEMVAAAELGYVTSMLDTEHNKDIARGVFTSMIDHLLTPKAPDK